MTENTYTTWKDWENISSYSFRKQRNPKKSVRLKNRTKYFDPSKDKTYVTFQSPETYASREIKKEGYETRLYYEFLWCSENNGQTFFYTLTYNDAHIPKYLGQNCFDYEDLRYLLNGGFKKKLLRKYGTNFRYFVGAELGDGKGERGMHNNPHYHILFFLRDAQDERYPYVQISPEDFRHLVREYWQGFDQDTDGRKPFQEALFGIAKEGENCGLVTDFRAVGYVSKYVCKDIALVDHEKKIRRKLGYKYSTKYKNTFDSYMDFFHDYIYRLVNTPLNPSKTKWKYDDKQVFKMLSENVPISFLDLEFQDDGWMNYREEMIVSTINFYHLWNEYYDYVNKHSQALVDDDIRVYRNRYTNKCRISQHTGDYALNFISDPMNPTIPMPSKRGIKNRPIGLFYYRKMFTEIFTDLNGKTTRILNPLGIEYKCANIQKNIDKLANKIQTNLIALRDNEKLYKQMIASDVNTDVFASFKDFQSMLSKALSENNISNICQRYAEYKLVYEDRFLEVKLDRDTGEYCFPDISVLSDYRRFITPSVGSVSRSSRRLNVFLENTPEDYIPYYAHPYFLRYSGIFAVLNLCADYFYVQGDDKRQREAEQIAEVKRFHNKLKLKDYYSSFTG